ncbi:9340_t:CDS:2 [Acaulospora colombiana]|uniref:9340_t:CDS:1 n=1 Tax=Acaulospora colombiana TaxID=27376 RepID=A0ACA9K9C1_9GLOM|nr:9340_t:CDS:2 [Acaulospora colombiana]
MEDIVQYQSDASSNESDGKSTEFRDENASSTRSEDHIGLNSVEQGKKRKTPVDRILLNTNTFEKSVWANKQIRGYVSKRAKLRQASETDLEAQQKDLLSLVPDVLPFDTKLLDPPSRIKSALNSKHSTNDTTQFSAIPKRRTVFLQKEHVKGINALLWCGSFEFELYQGQVLASASMDGTVKIWDVFRSKRCVRTIRHDGAVKDVKWDNYRNGILSGGYDQVVKLTDIETGTTMQSFPHAHIVTAFRYHPTQPNVFVSGMMKDGIQSWDLRSNKVIKESKKFWGGVNDLEFFPDGTNLLCCSDYVVRNSSDKNIMIWDINSDLEVYFYQCLLVSTFNSELSHIPMQGKGEWTKMVINTARIDVFNII